MTPRLSYLTIADRFVLGSVVLVFGAFGEAIATTALAARSEKDRAKAIDRVARVVFPVMFGIVLAGAFFF